MIYTALALTAPALENTDVPSSRSPWLPRREGGAASLLVTVLHMRKLRPRRRRPAGKRWRWEKSW